MSFVFIYNLLSLVFQCIVLSYLILLVFQRIDFWQVLNTTIDVMILLKCQWLVQRAGRSVHDDDSLLHFGID